MDQNSHNTVRDGWGLKACLSAIGQIHEKAAAKQENVQQKKQQITIASTGAAARPVSNEEDFDLEEWFDIKKFEEAHGKDADEVDMNNNDTEGTVIADNKNRSNSAEKRAGDRFSDSGLSFGNKSAPTPAQEQPSSTTSVVTQTLPSEAHPSQVHPTQERPPQASPVQEHPVQAHPVQAHLPQAHPVQAQPTQARPVQAHPSQVHPTHKAQYLNAHVVAPELLTGPFLKAAEEAYNKLWEGEHKNQLNQLTCCILATPSQQSATVNACAQIANEIWKHVLKQKLHDIQKLHVGLRIDPDQPLTRALLRQVLSIVHRNECSKTLNVSNINMTHQAARCAFEVLRLEAEAMLDLTRRCKMHKDEAVRKSGIKYRIIDGRFFDLVNIMCCKY